MRRFMETHSRAKRAAEAGDASRGRCKTGQQTASAAMSRRVGFPGARRRCAGAEDVFLATIGPQLGVDLRLAAILGSWDAAHLRYWGPLAYSSRI